MTDSGKISPSRKKLIDEVVYNLEHYNSVWKKGWQPIGVPESGITGNEYTGLNAFFLSVIAAERGYADSRWLTFNQIEKNGWTFKKDKNGESIAKNQGVQIEYYDLKDRKTKERFDSRIIAGLSKEDRDSYIKENVYVLKKYYTVFNASLVLGIKDKNFAPVTEEKGHEAADKVISYWSENEAKIVFEGDEAYYSKREDTIYIPSRSLFKNNLEFYQTVFHEMSHSTGHPKRLNRDLSGMYGATSYAVEELRAEIAGMFIQQDLGIEIPTGTVKNNSAYIKSWVEEIRNDPQYLLEAIKDADRISKYIYSKARAKNIDGKSAEDILTEIDGETKTSREVLTDNDKKIIERLSTAERGAEFKKLYNGESVSGNKDKDRTDFLRRVSVFSRDEATVMRIFKSSKLYSDNSINTKLVSDAFSFTESLRRRSGHNGQKTRYIKNNYKDR